MIADNENSELQRAMARIRQKRHLRIEGLHYQAERMVDWREHVKAAPVTALIASSVVGFMLVRGVMPRPRAARPMEAPPEPVRAPSTSTSNKLMRTAISLVTPMLYSMAKNFATQQLHQFTHALNPHSDHRVPENSRNGGIS